MIQLILNDEHMAGVLGEALTGCRHRLFIATANVKDLHLPLVIGGEGGVGGRGGRGVRARSIIDLFAQLSSKGVEVRLLHGGVPSSSVIARLKEGLPRLLTMRRCVRMHAKAVIMDGRLMYLGSANLTGAGLGAKSARRRNFEAGIWTDELSLIDGATDMLDGIWSGDECRGCGRRDNCPVPLEEPQL